MVAFAFCVVAFLSAFMGAVLGVIASFVFFEIRTDVLVANEDGIQGAKDTRPPHLRPVRQMHADIG